MSDLLLNRQLNFPTIPDETDEKMTGFLSDLNTVLSDEQRRTFDSIEALANATAGATTALDNLASVAINTSLISDTDDTDDLGSAAKQWKDLYIDGTANIDSLVADTADIDGGTIDGATIATSDITVGAGKTLDVSAGTLTLADNQISGDKVEGGTIASITLTSADINGGTLDSVGIGTTTATGELIVNDANDYADGLGSQGSSGEFLTSAGAGANPTWSANPVSAGSIDNTELNTTSGVGSTTSNNVVMVALPGGAYGFYPQTKTSSAGAIAIMTFIGYSGNTLDPGQTYATQCAMKSNGAITLSAQQTYVTASGTDMWIFLLVDKTTDEFLGIWQAPDHPSYGNGGDADTFAHPFRNFDNSKQKIYLLDIATTDELEVKELATGKDMVDLIWEDYELVSGNKPYVPLHSGQFIDEEPVLIETIPNYIKVRALTEMSQANKDSRQAIKDQKNADYEAEQTEKKNKKNSGKNKLKQLGLTQEEVDALIE